MNSRNRIDVGGIARANGRQLAYHLPLAVVILTLAFPALLKAVPVKDTSTSGDWGNGANWTGGDGNAPVAGESVNIDLAMTVNTSASFGDDVTFEPSLWGTSPDWAVTIASGQVLTHVADSTIEATNKMFINGPGKFRNEGTVLPKDNWLLLWQNGATFENAGAVIYDDAGGRMSIYAGNQFNNVSGGSVLVDLDSATDVLRMHGSDNSNRGEYTNSGGSAITFNNGILSHELRVTGGLTDASFANLFDDTSLNSTSSQLRLSGEYSQITLSNATDVTNVRLGRSLSTSPTDSFLAAPGGTTIDVINPAGIQVAQSNNHTIFETASGRDFTNVSGSKIVILDDTDFFHTGSGTFVNQGEMEIGQSWFLFWTGTAKFDNSGDIEFKGAGETRVEMRNSGQHFHNLPGGSININLPNATDLVRVFGNENTTAEFVNTGDPIVFQQGVLAFGPPSGGTMTDAGFAATFDATSLNSTSSELALSGSFESISLSGATDLTNVRLGHAFSTLTNPTNIGSNRTVAAAGGTTYNFSGPDGIQVDVTGGNYNMFHAEAGRSFTNVAGSKIVAPDGANFFHTGFGEFNNDGTIEVQNAWLLTFNAGGGTPTFNNNAGGLVEYQKNGGRLDVRNGTAFNNSGTLRIDLPASGDIVNVANLSGSGTGTFNNTGVVEITGGNLVFPVSFVSVPQISGGDTLTGGTWRVLADAQSATLNLQSGGTSAGSIDTIGAGATVVLSESGAGSANFPQLGSVTTLDGGLYVHGGVALPVGASPMNVSGTLGGDGTYNPTDQIVFSGGTLDPAALDGTGGTLTINGEVILSNSTILDFYLSTPGAGGPNDLVIVAGDLTLDGVLNIEQIGPAGTYRLFDYTGELTDLGLTVPDPNKFFIDTSILGQVNLVAVPEPSTVALIGLGTCALVAARRRRRRR